MTTAPMKKKRTTARKLTALEQTLIDISEKKKKVDALKKEILLLESDAIAGMERVEGETIDVHHGKETIHATIVRGEKVILDEEVLAKKVGAPTFNKITLRVVDSTKLAEAIKAGTVNEVDVAASSTLRPLKPYVKITRK